MASRTTVKAKNTQTISTIIGDKEKIESFIEATKTDIKGKIKDKKYYVVITHLKGSHLNYTFFLINQTKDNLRLKQRFGLIELQAVDFLASDDSRLDFQLSFVGDVVYNFFAENWEKKNKFLVDLWKLCKSILPKEALPIFKNVNTQMLAETVYLLATLKGMENNQGRNSFFHAESVEHEYKYLTKEEEIDLQTITEECEWETENVEAFIKKLDMELSGLDKANIQSILNVESEVKTLFSTMDEATKELNILEKRLNHYAELLDREESKILAISQVSNTHVVKVDNNQRLLQKCEELLELLYLPYNLEEFDSINDHNLESFSKAVTLVNKKVDILRNHELSEMVCVIDMLKYCQNFLDSVPDMLYTDLNAKFQRDWQSKHRARHYNISRFSSLLEWCREYNKLIYDAIFQSYEVSIKKCYEKEIASYFRDKIGSIQKRANIDKGFSFAGKASAQSVIDISTSQRNIRSGSLGSVDSIHTKGSGDSMAHFQQQNEQFSKFDGLFLRVLEFITPLVVEEEEHLNQVFGIPKMEDIPPDASEENARAQKNENTRVNKILLKLFGSKLEQELHNLIDISYKMDNYYSLFMYLRLYQYCNSQENSIFLTRFYSSFLIIVKRYFEQFINNQVGQIMDMRANKNKRCGILTCVHRFQFFLDETERIFDGRDRRIEIEKGYMSLLRAIFEAINRISKEQQKVPPEVVIFENYHRINGLLRPRNIEYLKKLQLEAKKVYETNLNEYVTVKLSNPIEKVSEFFGGVKQALTSTVKDEEVGFQLKYSRSTLKAILKQYQIKDVKKAIEHVLGKMEKQLCTEESLFEEVCKMYKDNLLSQIDEYQDLMRRCYPDSGLSFEFRKDEISRIFDMKIANMKSNQK